MITNENAVNELLSLLHSWHPISSHFRMELTRLLDHQQVKPKQQLCNYGNHVSNTWYSVDCWIVAFQYLPLGIEEVANIYSPGSIITEPHSFLQKSPSKQRISILEGRSVLFINKAGFNQLRNLSETSFLLEHSLLEEQLYNHWRMDILAMKDSDKVHAFAQKYPLTEIPGNIAASFLRMTQAHYSTTKSQYIRNK